MNEGGAPPYEDEEGGPDELVELGGGWPKAEYEIVRDGGAISAARESELSSFLTVVSVLDDGGWNEAPWFELGAPEAIKSRVMPKLSAQV